MSVAGTQLLVVILSVVAIMAVVVITALAVVLFVTKVMIPRSKERREAGPGED